MCVYVCAHTHLWMCTMYKHVLWHTSGGRSEENLVDSWVQFSSTFMCVVRIDDRLLKRVKIPFYCTIFLARFVVLFFF